MGFEYGIDFDSLKRDFGQIHSSTKEGIGIWCGSWVQVYSLWGEETVIWEKNQYICKT